MASPATEPVHRVTVPSADEMSAETFRLHIRLRHHGIYVTLGASRAHHDVQHRNLPRGFLDHVHLDPEE